MTDLTRDDYIADMARQIRVGLQTVGISSSTPWDDLTDKRRARYLAAARAIDEDGLVLIPRRWLSALLRLHDELSEMTCLAPSSDACAVLDKVRIVAEQSS